MRSVYVIAPLLAQDWLGYTAMEYNLNELAEAMLTKFKL